MVNLSRRFSSHQNLQHFSNMKQEFIPLLSKLHIVFIHKCKYNAEPYKINFYSQVRMRNIKVLCWIQPNSAFAQGFSK
jgi:hypothetical protein